MVFLAWSPARWGSRSPHGELGIARVLPDAHGDGRAVWRTTTPWRARGMVVHWYFLMPL